MATYAAYRHIELDKVGYGKKRVRNPPSDIFQVLRSPTGDKKMNGSSTPRRHNDSFNRLFGTPDSTPRRASFHKHDVTTRNPVTGNGVQSFDCRTSKNQSPRIHNERNPVTGEHYTIVSPASTPTKTVSNGFPLENGQLTPKFNGRLDISDIKPVTNGQA